MILKKVIYYIKKYVSCNVSIDKDDDCDCLKGIEFVINIIFFMKCFWFFVIIIFVIKYIF